MNAPECCQQEAICAGPICAMMERFVFFFNCKSSRAHFSTHSFHNPEKAQDILIYCFKTCLGEFWKKVQPYTSAFIVVERCFLQEQQVLKQAEKAGLKLIRIEEITDSVIRGMEKVAARYDHILLTVTNSELSENANYVQPNDQL